MTPVTPEENTMPAIPTPTDVVRAMYGYHLPLAGHEPFELIAEAWRTTATLLNLEYDHSAGATNQIGPIVEQTIALLYATAGIADTGTVDTPDQMATIEQARQVMARAADVTDIRLVPPLDDERRGARLVDATPGDDDPAPAGWAVVKATARGNAQWLVDADEGIWEDHPIPVSWDAGRESAECPYCGHTFYAPPLHDPLRKHVDYCDQRPEADDD